MAESHARRARVLLSDIRFQVDRGDSPAILEAASSLMRASWPPPSLDYSPDLLKWHLGFPGDARPFCVSGWLGPRCVAFAAATPRTVRIGEWTGTVMVKSFMTVDADLKGRGLGRDLRRRIVEKIASHAQPILRFGEPLHGVDTVLAQDYGAGGLQLRLLGPCVAAAVLARGGGPADSPDEADWATGWRSRPTEIAIDPAPRPAEVAHYLRDPRPRTLAAVRDAEGGLAAAAMVVRAAVRTRRGMETNVQLEQLLVGRNARPEHLARLAADAAYWGHPARSGVVAIPNVGDTPWPLLASAGFRKQAARYSAWVASAANHPLQRAQATNLEIV